LKLLTLFAKHFHIQVSRTLDPVFVDFDRQGPNQSQAAFLIGEDSDDMGSAFELLIEPFGHMVLLRCLWCSRGSR
jgi:hypothetical protein